MLRCGRIVSPQPRLISLIGMSNGAVAMDAFSGKPTRLGNLLNTVVRKRGIAEQSSGQQLENLWKRVAGERVAAKSYVRKLRNGVLEITVTNGAILEELTCYLKHDLLEELGREHPDPPITQIKFVKAR